MTLEVTFNTVHPSNNDFFSTLHTIQPGFRMIKFPEPHWFSYQLQPSEPAYNKELHVLDIQSATETTIWISIDAIFQELFKNDVPDPSIRNFEENANTLFKKLITTQSTLSKNLIETKLLVSKLNLNSDELSNSNETTLETNSQKLSCLCAKVITFLKRQKFLSFSFDTSPPDKVEVTVTLKNHVFVNLTDNLVGKGGNRTVQAACMISVDTPVWVAKSVSIFNPEDHYSEVKALSALTINENSGLIKTYSYGDALIQNSRFYYLFQELYTLNLREAINNPHFPLSFDDKISLTIQLLQGLDKLSDLGIHGDIHLCNIVCRKREGKIEGAIIDFETFQFYETAETRIRLPYIYRPPEYYSDEFISSKTDVWSLGICLFTLFANMFPPYIPTEEGIDETKEAILSLPPFWSDSCLTNLPDLVQELIKGMLNPNPELRYSADRALSVALQPNINKFFLNQPDE